MAFHSLGHSSCVATQSDYQLCYIWLILLSQQRKDSSNNNGFHKSCDGKLALMHHVIENVFALPTNHPLATALTHQAGILEIGDILSMPYDDIVDLTYTDDQGNAVPVEKVDKYRLRIIKYYHHHRITAGDPIEDWLTLTREKYHEYRVSKDYDVRGRILFNYNDR